MNRRKERVNTAAQTASPSQEAAAAGSGGSPTCPITLWQLWMEKKLFCDQFFSVLPYCWGGGVALKTGSNHQHAKIQSHNQTRLHDDRDSQAQSTEHLRVCCVWGETNPERLNTSYISVFIHAQNQRQWGGGSPQPCPPTRERLGSSSRK